MLRAAKNAIQNHPHRENRHRQHAASSGIPSIPDNIIRFPNPDRNHSNKRRLFSAQLGLCNSIWRFRMRTLVVSTTSLATALALIASAAVAAPATKKMTDTRLDLVVGGWLNPGGNPCGTSANDCGNNGWGNGYDLGTPGSDEGKTATSKTLNAGVSWAGKVNMNPTTSDGR
jgi:hypothetical protein